MPKYLSMLKLKPVYRVLLKILAAIITMTGCAVQKEPGYHIILCIGQSNMAGRAEMTPADTIPLQNVFLFNERDEWEPAKNPLNRYSTIRKEISMQRLGPAWTFSKSLVNAYPGKNFGLVVNVRGGTSINRWEKGSHHYNEAVIKALKAQKSGTIIGVIWHQGEADRNKWEGYTEKFSEMIGHLRNDLGIPDLPVVVGEIGDWKGNSGSINAQIRSIPEKVPFTRCVNADGLMHMGDTLHFNTEAQYELGKRYAKEFIQLIRIQ